MMAALPTQALLKLGGVVVFPAYSRAKANGSNFQDVFDRVRLPLLAGAALITTALVAGGHQLIEFLYDPRYHRAGWMLQLLAVSGWFQVMQVTNGSALLALGAPRSVAVGNMVKLATMVIIVPLGFWWHGLLGGILGIILSDVLKYVASVYLVARHGLHMLGKDVIVSAGVAVLSVACLAAANWTETRWAAHWAATHVAPAGKLAAKIGPLLALGVVTALSCAAWLPLVARSLRSRKAVS
jgi:O-antigen/teichoic acid export membrane protein